MLFVYDRIFGPMRYLCMALSLLSLNVYACGALERFLLSQIPAHQSNTFEKVIKEVSEMTDRDMWEAIEKWEYQIFNIGDPSNDGKIRKYHAGLNTEMSDMRLKDLPTSEYSNITQSLTAHLQNYLYFNDGDLQEVLESFRMVAIISRLSKQGGQS